MDVLLARPPNRNRRQASLHVPPLGLAYVASAVRQAGHAIEILDAPGLDWDWPKFEAYLRQRRPQVLGLGTMTPVADLAARAAKVARPFVDHIVLGGPHPTAVKDEVFSSMPELDAAVVGEAEESTPALLTWWARGSQGDPPPGVLAPGRPFVAHTPERPLTELARPAWDLLPMQRYRYLMATRARMATMVTSRGCPFRCTFCDKSVSGSRWRARPPEHVVDEMAHLVSNYGVGFINLYDDNFTLKRSRVMAICEEIIRRRLDVHWKCEGRVDGVDPAMLKLMHRAGCRVVAYGVESASPQTLEKLRKDIRLDQVETAFASTRAAGLRSVAYMILGAPGEDADEVRRSVRFCREIGADYVQFSTLTALPGTPLFQTATASADVRNPVDADLHRATVTDLPADQLARLLRQAWLGFYLRPRPMALLARSAVQSGSISEAFRMGLAMTRWGTARSA